MTRNIVPAAQQQIEVLIAKIRPLLNIQNALAVILILFFAGINIVSVLREFSLTTDEDKHYLYGENILAGDSTRFDDSKMPVTALNGLPKKLGALTGNERIAEITSRFYVARMVTILFSCLAALLVFFWSKRLYGVVPAIFSLSLYVFDPNIIAHSQLVTTDVYVTGMFLFSFYWLWKFANERNLKNGLFCLLTLALSQVAKYTAVVLFPLFIVSLLFFDWLAPEGAVRKGWSLQKLSLNYVKYGVYVIVITTVVVNIAFLFNGSFMKFGEYNFGSSFFQKIQNSFPILQNIPVPVPYPYLQGLDLMRTTERTGVLSGNVYFLGQVSTLDGFPGYYLVASLLKVPIATQLIFILALLIYFIRPGRRSQFVQNEMFLLLPVLFFVIYFNFFFNTQIGIRYYLPIYPLLYVFSGSLFSGWDKFSFQLKAVSCGLVLYACVSILSYHPYYMSYFNEFMWDRKQAYKYLADSNLDWGQAKNELWLHISEHPGAIYEPKKVRAGYIVVGINNLVGVTDDPRQYAWLRENFEPIGTVAYSYLIYDISPEEINALCATTTYCQDD